ncbi:MAG: tripartite tricarboxylate transporter TctB family protein [Deltaproteobacteria bacterium]|nr:tripartite tricarboxylate transporter TctB family protein [Deltaproteobacteria bacterium]
MRDFFNYYRYVILGFLAFFGYVVLMYYFGYPISTLIFMPVLMWVLGPRNKKAALVITVTTLGVTFVIYYSFLKLLRVFLPEGSLF